jgi:ankyrin repeat protein
MIFYIQENNFNFVKQTVNTISIFLNINCEDNFGNTLLCHIVRYSSDDVIEFFLTNVANLNIYNVSFS